MRSLKERTIFHISQEVVLPPMQSVVVFCLGTKFENHMSYAAFPCGIAVFLTSLYGLHFTDLLKIAMITGVILFVAIYILSRKIPKEWLH